MRILVLVAVGCLIPACSLAPKQTPEVLEAVEELPAGFAGSEAGPYEPLEWWKTFADPALDRVIAAALASNFDLAEAVARVEQARQRERIAKSSAFPLAQPVIGASDSDTPTNVGIGAQFDELGLGPDQGSAFGIVLPDRLGLTTYSASAELAYEVDFWGRNRNDGLAAGAERLASEADYLTARMGVLAETVRTYLEIVNLRRQERFAGQIVELLRDLESLAVSRYDRGLIDARGLHAARRHLREAQAELPQIEALLADAEGRLRVLLGGYREDLAGLLSGDLAPAPSARTGAGGHSGRPAGAAARRRRREAAGRSGPLHARGPPRGPAAEALPARFHRSAGRRRRRVVRPGPVVPQSEPEPARPRLPGGRGFAATSLWPRRG